MNISHRADFDAATPFDFENESTIDNPPETPREEALRGNLTKWRCRLPVLRPEEQRALLQRAQAGDAAAKNTLLERYHRLVLSIASKYSGPDFEDLLAAGLLGLTAAIAKFDLRKNYAFASLAKSEIKYRILDELGAWRRRGRAGATRADRYLDFHPLAAAEDVADAVGVPLAAAVGAVERSSAWGRTESYADWLRVPTRKSACFRKPDRIDRLAAEADRRAQRRLNEIGRRAYALELVEHDRKRIEARAEPSQYLYPPAVRHFPAVLQSRADAEHLRLERSWGLLSASASQLRRLRQQAEVRPARHSPEWWQWRTALLASWHAEVRANVYQKEDQRPPEDVRARRELEKKPQRSRPRKSRIRVWRLEHEPLLAAE